MKSGYISTLDLWLPSLHILKHFHFGLGQKEILHLLTLPVLLFYILTR